jgi:hypothetical protein
MRALGPALLLALAACATVPGPVAEYSVCERNCSAKDDHCSDDTKDRETGPGCAQDLRQCLDLCDAQAQADPSDREQTSKPRREPVVPGSSEPAGRIVPRGR